MPNVSLVSLVGLTFAFCSVAQAKSPINLDILRRDGYGVVQLSQARENVLTVSAVVNGQKVKLELDTGFSSGGMGLDSRYSGVNVATGNDVHQATGVSGKSYPVRRGVVKTIVMGNVQLTDVPVEVGAFKVFDEEHSQKFGSALAFDMDIGNPGHPAGFIGRDFLRANSAIIDLANRLLYLKPPGKGKKAQLGGALTKVGMGEAPLQGNLVDVEVNGVAAKMVVDTGAVATLLDPRFAAKVNARGFGSTNMEFSDISGARARVDLTGLANFKIGGVPARSFVVTLIPFSAYPATGGKLVGLLGIDFLGQNWGIIDFGQQKLYFAKK